MKKDIFLFTLLALTSACSGETKREAPETQGFQNTASINCFYNTPCRDKNEQNVGEATILAAAVRGDVAVYSADTRSISGLMLHSDGTRGLLCKGNECVVDNPDYTGTTAENSFEGCTGNIEEIKCGRFKLRTVDN